MEAFTRDDQIVSIRRLLAQVDVLVPAFRMNAEQRMQRAGYVFTGGPTFVTLTSDAVLAHPEHFDRSETARAQGARDYQLRHNALRGLQVALADLTQRCADLALSDQAAAIDLCLELQAAAPAHKDDARARLLSPSTEALQRRRGPRPPARRPPRRSPRPASDLIELFIAARAEAPRLATEKEPAPVVSSLQAPLTHVTTPARGGTPVDTHDYVQFVEQPSTPPLDLSKIPSAQGLASLGTELRAIEGDVLDLEGLKDLGTLTAAATPEDLERTRILIDLVQEAPELCDVAKVPRTLLKDAYDMDMRMLRLTSATFDLRQQTQVGERFIKAKLTEHNDRVEDTVTALVNDASVSERERREIEYTFTFPGFARAWEAERQGARNQRRDLRQRRLQEQLQTLEQAAEAERQRQRLIGLAQPPTPVKKSKKKASK